MNKNNTYTRDLFALGFIFFLVFFLFLGVPALNVPDEGRYAEIPREMLLAHQYVVPHLDGLIYFEKPPLAYWLVAGFMKLFGQSELVVRALNATLGFLGCLITYIIARAIFNRRTGILSSLILSSSTLYFAMGRFNTTDMCLTFCITLSLYSFLFAFQTEKPRDRWLWTGYFFSGLAMMAKGLIGIVFSACIIFIWIASTGRWAILKNMRIVSGFFIILAVNLPWILLAQQRVPDFLHFYFIVQQFERYSTPIMHREMGFAIYIGILLMATFPWVVFLPQAIKYNLRQLKNTKTIKGNTLFLFIWPTFIVLFFAFSHSILIPYLLPIVPPLAILLGRYFDHALSISGKITARMIGAILVGAYAMFIIAWLIVLPQSHHSIKPLGITINELMKKHPDAEIVSFGYRQDLPYYTQHIVTLAGNAREFPPHSNSTHITEAQWDSKNPLDRDELTFGVEHDQSSKNWMIDVNTFWRRWDSDQRLYVVMGDKRYTRWLHDPKITMYLIQRTDHDVLVTNRSGD